MKEYYEIVDGGCRQFVFRCRKAKTAAQINNSRCGFNRVITMSDGKCFVRFRNF